MRTKTRLIVAGLSDAAFIGSVALGSIALLLEDTSSALRALALNELPEHVDPADLTWSPATGTPVGSVAVMYDPLTYRVSGAGVDDLDVIDLTVDELIDLVRAHLNQDEEVAS